MLGGSFEDRWQNGRELFHKGTQVDAKSDLEDSDRTQVVELGRGYNRKMFWWSPAESFVKEGRACINRPVFSIHLVNRNGVLFCFRFAFKIFLIQWEKEVPL